MPFDELYEKTLLGANPFGSNKKPSYSAGQFSSNEVDEILAKAKQKFGNDLNTEKAQAWIKAQILRRKFSQRTEKLKTNYPKLFAAGNVINPFKLRSRIDRAGNWLKTL